MADTNEMRRKRARLISEARKILDSAEEEKRDLSAEEEARFEKMMEEQDNLAKKIEREEKLSLEEKSLTQVVAGREDQTSDGEGSENPRGSKEYRDSFWKAIRQTRNALDAHEVRALQVGTDTEGGFLVPEEFERTLVQRLEDINIMRTLSTIITTSSDRSIPVVTSHGSASWIAEEGTFAESDEAFGQKTLFAHKVGTLIKISEELLQDSAFDLAAYIASEFARRVGNAEEAAFVNGNGVGKPLGVVVDAEVGVTAAGASAVTADELINLFHSLRRPYRRRATFVMADSTAKAVRKLKETGGQYIWQPGLQAGVPDSLLGRPVAISDDVPAMATTNRSILFGDFSYYWIADRAGRVLQRLSELYAASGQVGFKAYQRVDGKLTLTEAVKCLVHP